MPEHEPEHEPARKAEREPEHERSHKSQQEGWDSAVELPPGDIGGVVAVVVQVAGDKMQPSPDLVGSPAAPASGVGVGTVGGRDEGIKEMDLDRPPSRQGRSKGRPASHGQW